MAKRKKERKKERKKRINLKMNNGWKKKETKDKGTKKEKNKQNE